MHFRSFPWSETRPIFFGAVPFFVLYRRSKPQPQFTITAKLAIEVQDCSFYDTRTFSRWISIWKKWIFMKCCKNFTKKLGAITKWMEMFFQCSWTDWIKESKFKIFNFMIRAHFPGEYRFDKKWIFMNYCKMFTKKWEPTLSGVTSNELNQRKKDEPFEAKSSFCRRRVLFDWRRLAYRPYVKNGVHHDWFSAPPPPTDHRRNGYYDAAASSGDYYDRFYSYDLEEATRPRSLGQGQIRVSGRQAEISCLFPAHLDIVSVSWPTPVVEFCKHTGTRRRPFPRSMYGVEASVALIVDTDT